MNVADWMVLAGALVLLAALGWFFLARAEPVPPSWPTGSSG